MKRARPRQTPNRPIKKMRRDSKSQPELEESRIIAFKLDGDTRYAHTATRYYHLTMASLQPNEQKLPNCVCKQINESREKRKRDDRTILIVEHDLKEHILCVLGKENHMQCKLDMIVQPGEQIAYRTVGKHPIVLHGYAKQ